jgi:ribosomal protein S8
MLAHDLATHIFQSFRARRQRIAVNHTVQNLAILTVLLQHGFLSSLTRGTLTGGPHPSSFLSAPVSDQRIWAELKFRDDRPVLTSMSAVSIPSRRVFMDNDELLRFCTGRRVNWVKPLDLGEVAVVRVRPDVRDEVKKVVGKQNPFLEAREALRMGLEGEVLCRAR